MLEKDSIPIAIPIKNLSANNLAPFIHCSSIASHAISTSASWLAYIASLQERITLFFNHFLAEEGSSSHESSVSDAQENKDSYLQILDRLKVQKEHKYLSRAISRLFLDVSQIKASPLSAKQIVSEKETETAIQELADKGYARLAEILENKHEFPWNRIKAIRHPVLIEQLGELYQLCELKYPKRHGCSKEKTEKILSFALSLAELATLPNLNESYTHSQEIVNHAKHILGQLIYLTDHQSEHILSGLSSIHLEESLNKIDREFEASIQQMSHQLQQHYTAHCETGIQSPDIAFHTKIPLEVAKALLTETGAINIGVIDLFANRFLTSDPPLNHQINLAYGLRLIQHSSKIRLEFARIHKPNSPSMPSNDVIRAILDLSPEVKITDLHAKQAILASLLSHLRQGKAGSCFATSLATEILSAHLGFCLKDMKELIHDSKLTRTIKNVSKDIPFIKWISDDDLTKKIRLDSKGNLLLPNQKSAPLWEAPGILSACQAIGVKNAKKRFNLSCLLTLINKKLRGRLRI